MDRLYKGFNAVSGILAAPAKYGSPVGECAVEAHVVEVGVPSGINHTPRCLGVALVPIGYSALDLNPAEAELDDMLRDRSFGQSAD